jgi:hypothetical protein
MANVAVSVGGCINVNQSFRQFTTDDCTRMIDSECFDVNNYLLEITLIFARALPSLAFKFELPALYPGRR